MSSVVKFSTVQYGLVRVTLNRLVFPLRVAKRGVWKKVAIDVACRKFIISNVDYQLVQANREGKWHTLCVPHI